jgi:hypothetical protein
MISKLLVYLLTNGVFPTHLPNLWIITLAIGPPLTSLTFDHWMCIVDKRMLETSCCRRTIATTCTYIIVQKTCHIIVLDPTERSLVLRARCSLMWSFTSPHLFSSIFVEDALGEPCRILPSFESKLTFFRKQVNINQACG